MSHTKNSLDTKIPFPWYTLKSCQNMARQAKFAFINSKLHIMHSASSIIYNYIIIFVAR